MRKYIIILIFALIYIFSQPSLAIELEKCKYCHGAIKPIPKDIITKPCSACHGMHSSPEQPEERNPEIVHLVHSSAGRYVSQADCKTCHQSPIRCANCHNPHEDISKITIRRQNTSQNLSCINCHGRLPQPKGHEDFRIALANSRHNWMTCDTCHKSGEKFELGFKNLLLTPIDDSVKICKICHSLQYEDMKEGIHGTLDKTCISCHNPHTTTSSQVLSITPKETPVNMSIKIEKSKEWIFEKMPILKNPTMIFIIFIILLVVVAEYILSRHEEGQKVAYHMVKFSAGEETLKTLEVKLKNQNVNILNEILEKYGNILGMTMAKEKDMYKYIIFVDINRPMDDTGERDILDQILLLNDVKSVQFTDKYEL